MENVDHFSYSQYGPNENMHYSLKKYETAVQILEKNKYRAKTKKKDSFNVIQQKPKTRSDWRLFPKN